MSTTVLPPANGKKMWRVKRKPSASSGSTVHNTSIECLNNSLKISTAAATYVVKRPPLKRPKNKPGKPKDFVFVDLSPVKSEEDEVKPKKLDSVSSTISTGTIPPQQTMPSPTSSVEDSINSSIFDFTQWDDSFNPTEEETFNTTQSDKEVLLGLGIQFAGLEQWSEQQEAAQPAPASNVDNSFNFTDPINWFGTASVPEYPQHQRTVSLPNTTSVAQPHKRLMSAVEYPNKRQRYETPKMNSTAAFACTPSHSKAAYCEPNSNLLDTPKLGLDDLLMLNYQFKSTFHQQQSAKKQTPQQPQQQHHQDPLVFSPISDFSEDDSLGKPMRDVDAAFLKDLNLNNFLKLDDLELGNFVTF